MEKFVKQICIILIAVIFLAAIFGCNRQPGTSSELDSAKFPGSAEQTFELALITDFGDINDKSFNQGSWEGLVLYAAENNISHKYYHPAGNSDSSYLAAIDLAVHSGAKVIVTPGFLFEVSVFIAQDRYPDVYFILIDGVPHSADYSIFKTGNNVVSILFAENQAGFLAGYAAVKDGYRRLGFLGGMAVPSVVLFGNGFIHGAEYAAQELGLAAGSIVINYHYTGHFNATPEVQTMAASWYNDGIEVIFACGGALGSSVISAAEQAGKSVIGVDVDQSGESLSVITSAMKKLQISIYNCISSYYLNSFPGGQTLILDVSSGGVGLPMATSRFRTFNSADYNAIFGKLANNEIPMINNIDINGSPDAVPVDIARIIEVR